MLEYEVNLKPNSSLHIGEPYGEKNKPASHGKRARGWLSF